MVFRVWGAVGSELSGFGYAELLVDAEGLTYVSDGAVRVGKVECGAAYAFQGVCYFEGASQGFCLAGLPCESVHGGEVPTSRRIASVSWSGPAAPG